MRCLFALLVLVAFAAGASLRHESADRLSELEAKRILDHDVEAAVSDLKDVDVPADNVDPLERDFFNPYNSYNPYGGYGGYPYYPPFYPPFFSQPSTSTANAVALANGGGFFGGNSNANAIAVSGGGGGGGGGLFGGRRRRDVDPVVAVEAAKERIAEIEKTPKEKAEKMALIDAVKQKLADNLVTDVVSKLESVKKIKELIQSERILSSINNENVNSVAVASNNGIGGNADAFSLGLGRRRRDVELDDLFALLDKDVDTKSDVVERGFGYGGYPYGGYGGYPYGGFGGYPYPPFFGGYPGFFGGGGGSTSANSVAVANGNGFFGGDTTANSVAIAGRR